jgi:hypothetical protein
MTSVQIFCTIFEFIKKTELVKHKKFNVYFYKRMCNIVMNFTNFIVLYLLY